MLSVEQLQGLNPGDVIEAGAVFQNVSDEPLCFKVERKRRSANARNGKPVQEGLLVEFSVWYFDIRVGTFYARVDGDRVRWMDMTESIQRRNS